MRTRSQTGDASAAPLFVDVVFVGDRSASMVSMGDGLFNGAINFVKTHVESAEKSGLGDKYKLQVISFDDLVTNVYSGNAIDFYNSNTDEDIMKGFKPCGTTRLYDTIIEQIKEQSKRVDDFKATLHRKVLELNPRIVTIFAVLTDGEDNSSMSSSLGVKKNIEKHINEYNTSCQFIAANQSANYVGGKMGFPLETCLQMDADPEHAEAAMESVALSAMRTISGQSGEFSIAERTISSNLKDWSAPFDGNNLYEDDEDEQDEFDCLPQRH